MWKKKKHVLLAAALGGVLLLNGCVSGQKQAGQQTNALGEENEAVETSTGGTAESVNFPESYQETVNGVAFELKVEVLDGADLAELQAYSAQKQYPDSSAAQAVFASGKNVQEENKHAGTGEDGRALDNISLTFEDASTLVVDKTLVYGMPFFAHVCNAFRNPELYSQKGEFPFSGPEKAFQDIIEKANASGYMLEDMDYEYYALDAGIMAQEEVVYSKTGEVMENGGREWTDEDSSYYFFGEQTLSGIPVYYGNQDFPEDSLDNRPLQAVYSSRGIEYLYITQVYTFDPEEEKLSLAEFEKAVECVAYKYGNILTDAKYKATRAKLYWKPMESVSGGYSLRPVWLFEIHETGIDSETGESFENVIYTFVDAVTGEEVSA